LTQGLRPVLQDFRRCAAIWVCMRTLCMATSAAARLLVNECGVR